MFHGQVLQLISVLVLMATMAVTSPSQDSERRDMLLDALRARRNQCAGASAQCFSTGQCCNGLVCAVVDDVSGQQADSPGSCVKEKDLKSCQTESDCEGRARCVPVGRTSELYCLPRPSGRSPAALLYRSGQVTSGGLGSTCEASSECSPTTKDGKDELCCKAVLRGRQGAQRICDRMETSGACILPRN